MKKLFTYLILLAIVFVYGCKGNVEFKIKDNSNDGIIKYYKKFTFYLNDQHERINGLVVQEFDIDGCQYLTTSLNRSMIHKENCINPIHVKK